MKIVKNKTVYGSIKKRWVMSVSSLCLVLLISSTAHTQYNVGDVVSDFTLQSHDGSMISLSDYSDDVVLLTFWWFACPPCQQEAPVIQTELWEKYRDRNFQVISIGFKESLDVAELWAGLYLITHLVVIDEGSVFESYSGSLEFSSFPLNAIVGADGRLLYSEIAFDLETIDGIIMSNTTLVSIEDESANLPDEFNLHPAYPNPFNPSTMISFDLNVRLTLNLKIYDQLGREIITLFGGTLEQGKYFYAWNGRDNNGKKVSSGIYFSQLQAGDRHMTRKLTLLK